MTSIDPTPEQELAGAYLDGDVTAVERAHVEATPKLLALVASMREVKSLVAAVPTASDAVREMAIAAGLAQFDAIESGSNLAVSLPVSLNSRRRWPTRVMSAAAAVVLLGVVGISVLQNRSEDKSADTASRESDPKFEAQTADDAVGAAVPETTGGEEVMIGMASPIVIDDPQQLLELTVPLPPTADTTVADGGAGTTVATSQRGESYHLDALACLTDDQVFLADILYQGALAIAVRDTVTGVTEAIDSNCTVLASVSP